MTINNQQHIKDWNRYYFKNTTHVPWGYKKTDQHVLDFFQCGIIDEGSLVLDVGCGYGKNAGYCIEKGMKYYGIDIAKEAIIRAKNIYPDANFYLGDVLNLSLGKEFDIIIDAGCFHVNNPKNWEKILMNYHKLLVKGGRIFIRIFHSSSGSKKPLFIIDNLLPVWGDNREELEKTLEKHFCIEKVILDTQYYAEDEIFYFYLTKK